MLRRWRLTGEALAQFVEHGMGGEFAGFATAAMAVFEFAGSQAAITDDHAMRDAEQLGIGELHAGAGIAIIVERVDAGGAELRLQRIRSRAYGVRTIMV